MAIQPPDPHVNKEAIPAQQPIAASPGPQHRHQERSAWRSGWTYLLAALVLVTLLGALYRS
jgi:hypothetical protein